MAHPLELFMYCPKCGSEYFEINSFKSKHCSSCGFTYYQNPSSSTAAFILNAKGELLVVRRAKEPAKDTLDLPGGFVDNGETAEEGILREIKEETGLEVDAIEYLFSSPNVYMYSGLGVHTVDMDFLIRVHGDGDAIKAQVHAADDAAAAVWLPLDKVNPADFGLTSIRNAVIRFLHQMLRK
jgi:ADP-ribose pyrophosphatase YjhB (NUDIX family)